MELKPPFAEARQKLSAAIETGELALDAPIEGNQPAVEKICGWDSQDWVELMLWSEELPAELTTVGDLLKLLGEIGARYPER